MGVVRVQSAGGLVQNDHLRAGDHLHRDADALHLAPAEAAPTGAADAGAGHVRQPELLQHL